MLVCICVEFDLLLYDCVWVCVYVGGVVDVVWVLSLGVCGWIVSLYSGCIGCFLSDL